MKRSLTKKKQKYLPVCSVKKRRKTERREEAKENEILSATRRRSKATDSLRKLELRI